MPEQPCIVVVDNGSSDDTEGICEQFRDRVRFVKLLRNEGAAARTIGVRAAGTTFVAFCDDDCHWLPGSLERGVHRLRQHETVALLNGRVVIGEEERTDPACQAMRGTARSNGAPVPILYFMAGACIVRSRAFLEAGGYHARYLIGAEESLLSIDLIAQGWTLWYCDDLVMRHDPSPVNRNPELRRRLVLRNRLWTMFLRRSWYDAGRAVARYGTRALRDSTARAALSEAVGGLPWIVRERRKIPKDLERRFEALDRAFAP